MLYSYIWFKFYIPKNVEKFSKISLSNFLLFKKINEDNNVTLTIEGKNKTPKQTLKIVPFEDAFPLALPCLSTFVATKTHLMI